MMAHLSLIAFCMSRFICLNLPQTKRNLVNKPVSFWFLVILRFISCLLVKVSMSGFEE